MTFSTLRRRGSAALVAVAFCLLAQAAAAQTIETSARQAIIVEYPSGTILMEKNADEPMVPSSMSKLMTVYMVFDKLKSGAWHVDDQLPVTETAWKKHFKSGGSLMFLPVNSTASVDDLLKGVVIQSGNDACSVLAEALSGSEEAFAEEATRRARQLGMSRSTFRNASGWPEPDHLTTARDLSTLAFHLIGDFPDYYPLFGQREFVYNNIRQGNRNPLLYSTAGADGLKTGHTEAAGFGLVASVKRGDRRIVMVINGIRGETESNVAGMRSRAEEAQRLIEWAFREWGRYPLFKAGETVVADAPVWMGETATVPLAVASDVAVTLPRRSRPEMKVSTVFTGPIPAPVKAGTPVGKVVVSAPGVAPVEVPLVAQADVGRLGFGGRMIETIRGLFSGPAR